jgi:hypothetical protein
VKKPSQNDERRQELATFDLQMMCDREKFEKKYLQKPKGGGGDRGMVKMVPKWVQPFQIIEKCMWCAHWTLRK